MDGFEMREIHRLILARSRTYLIHNLRPTETFWSALRVKDVLSEDMIDEIKAMKIRSEQIGKMLDLLPARGPAAFDLFIEILLECDHPHVAEYLKTMEATDNFRTEISRHCTVTDGMVENMVSIYKHSTPIIKRFTEQKFEMLLQDQAKELEEQEELYHELENSYTVLKLENSQLQNFINTCHDLSEDVSRELQNEFVSKSFLRDTSSYLETLREQTSKVPSFDKMTKFYKNMQVILAHLDSANNNNNVTAEYKSARTTMTAVTTDTRSGRPKSVLRRLGSSYSSDRPTLKSKIQSVLKILGIVIQTMSNRSQITTALIKPDLEQALSVIREVLDDIVYVKDVFRSTLRQKDKLETGLLSLAHNWQEIRRLEREVKEKQGHISELNKESQVLRRKTRSQQHRKHLDQIRSNLEQKKVQLRELQKMLERHLGSADTRLHALLELLPDLEDDDGRSDTDISNTISTTSSRAATPKVTFNRENTNIMEHLNGLESTTQKDKCLPSSDNHQSQVPETSNGTKRLLTRREQQQCNSVTQTSNRKPRRQELDKKRDFRKPNIKADQGATSKEGCTGLVEYGVKRQEARKGQSAERKGKEQDKETGEKDMIAEWIERQKKENKTEQIQKKLNEFKIIETEDRLDEIRNMSIFKVDLAESSAGKHKEDENKADERNNVEEKNDNDSKPEISGHGDTRNTASQPVPRSVPKTRSKSTDSDSDKSNHNIRTSEAKSANKCSSDPSSRENSGGSDQRKKQKNTSPEIVDKPGLSMPVMGVTAFSSSSNNNNTGNTAPSVVRRSLLSSMAESNGEPRRSVNQGQRQALATSKVNLTLPGT